MGYRTGGQVVVDSLVANGVEVVFGIPGTHSLPIYRHLRSSGITHVTPRHEQGAGYAADGYARSSGRPGVCLVTTGPGVTNIATAVAQAYSDSIPLLVVSPGVPFRIDGGDHGFLHEMKSQIGVTASITAWSRRVTSHQELADSLNQAFAFFATGRARPVHIEVPLEILDQPGYVDGIWRARGAVAPPLESEIERAAQALRSASTRVLVLGGGARGATDVATRLVERLQMPAMTTMNGKGVVSERNPLSLGTAIMARAAQRYVDECDVVLAVGTELGDSDLWGGTLRPAGTVIRIDIDSAQLQKNLDAHIVVQADSKLALEALEARLVTASPTPRASSAQVARIRREIDDELASEVAPWREMHAELEKVLDANAIVAGDATMACYFGTGYLLPLEGPSQWLYPTGFCTLGYGLPAAIGAKIAHPDRQVIAVMGDGGVMFTLGELATAAELHLAIPLVVVTNGGYGEIRREMEALGSEPLGTDFSSPDFVMVARGLGGEGVRTTAAGLAHEAEEAFTRDRPTLIELNYPQ